MTTDEKIEQLQTIKQPFVTQIVKINWHTPDGAKYYATIPANELHPFRKLPFEVETRLMNKGFIPFELSPDLADEDVQLSFGDVDKEFQRLFSVHGEGVRVEIFYYYPEVDLLISRWFGQLNPPDSSGYGAYNTKASNGFLSRLMIAPRRSFFDRCPATFGFHLKTLDEIAHNDCPYAAHLGGFGVPGFTSCGKTTGDCTARLGDALSNLGFNVSASATIANKQGQLAVSRGNASNLKRPLRKVYGYKTIRDLDLLVWKREPNISTPDKGFVAAIWAVCEGEIQSMYDFRVNDGSINVQALNYRTGQLRQPPTSYAPGISNFSGTVLVMGRVGWVNANQIDATQLKTQITLMGEGYVRVYSDEDTYTETFTNNRVWCLMDFYADKRAGLGYDYSRFNLTDWGNAANDSSQIVTFTDNNGGTHTLQRTQFDCDMQGRQADEQIRDICISGRISVPFQHDGKLSIKVFQKESTENLQVFTDRGQNRNIVVDDKGISTLTYSQIPDKSLFNEVVLTFEDAANGDIERPLLVGDEEQQLKAGRAFGDTSLRVIQNRKTAYGIRNYDEALKLAHSLLYLGEFDSGGIKNNLNIQFYTFHTKILKRKKYDLIKVESEIIEIFGFQYFRIQSLKQQADGSVLVTAQAYPEEYYETFETEYVPPEVDPYIPPDSQIPVTDNPSQPIFQNIEYKNGYLELAMMNL